MDQMTPWLIVGLGNPGPAYAGHRHNIGAMVVEELAARAGANLRSHKARAVASEVRISVPPGGPPGGAPGPRAVIAIPLTYMNESGGPVAGLMSFYKVSIENLIVIHDDLDIPFAEVRLKLGGGEGGHNGLRSSPSPLAPGTICACASASVVRPGAWMPRTTCFTTSPAPNAARCPC